MQEINEMIEMVRKDTKECPWKKAQKIEEFVKEVSSELEELNEAIQNNDNENIKEEMGDLLWDAISLMFLVQRDKGINIEEAINDINKKIIRRKPHVFGDAKAETAEDALKIWMEVKEREKRGEFK